MDIIFGGFGIFISVTAAIILAVEMYNYSIEDFEDVVKYLFMELFMVAGAYMACACFDHFSKHTLIWLIAGGLLWAAFWWYMERRPEIKRRNAPTKEESVHKSMKEWCDKRDKERWPRISSYELNQLKTVMDPIYKRAKQYESTIKPLQGLSDFRPQNLSSPDEIINFWKKDEYSLWAEKNQGFPNVSPFVGWIHSKLYISIEFYLNNMNAQEYNSCKRALGIIEDFVGNVSTMDYHDAIARFRRGAMG